MATLQVHVVYGKKDERVAGPADADVVVTVNAPDASLDPTVAFMQGKLKATGHTGQLFDLLRSGEVARVIGQLAAG